MNESSNQSASSSAPRLFGTFGGVFTPSILTILGVILFLRSGYVVGASGVVNAAFILLTCELVVGLTAVSLAAISTNTQVKGGGAYYVISRVLGPEFGGSIGLCLYVAQALSVPFYILGFTEALTTGSPVPGTHDLWIALSTTAALFAVCWIGANWAVKVQYLVMVMLGLGILSSFVGLSLDFSWSTFQDNIISEYPEGKGFWSMFAIYFPAVTGIMTGVNMSGNLKNPARSIVVGTFAAIGVGALVYGVQIFFLAGSATRQSLLSGPYQTLLDHAVPGTAFLVTGGVVAASLSSALGSELGAPRVLQALSRDRIFVRLKIFAGGSKEGDEPRAAYLLTLCITVVTVVAAILASRDGFNLVARLVAMFFLCTYGMINLAAFLEAWTKNPSFRPRFRLFHWSVAGLGFFSCGASMVMIDWKSSIVAVAIIAGIYTYIRRSQVRNTFGDARRGFLYSRVTQRLEQLDNMPSHPKNWRPTILVFSGNPKSRADLVRCAIWMESGRGVVTLAQIMKGDLEQFAERRATALDTLREECEQYTGAVFPEVLIAPDFDHGVESLLQVHSIGPLKPNLVMFGWPRDLPRLEPFVRSLRIASMLGKSIVLVPRIITDVPKKPRIDIWWRGNKNGSLILILAYLVSRSMNWADTRIRLLRQVKEEAGVEPSKNALMELTEAARIDAEIEVVVSTAPFVTVLAAQSASASLTMLGFVPPPEEEAQQFLDANAKLIDALQSVVLVHSSGEADLLA